MSKKVPASIMIGVSTSKKFAAGLIVALLAGSAGYITFRFYPYLFAETVRGEVIGLERVGPAEAAIITPPAGAGPSALPNQLFSFAVAIRAASTGEIFTASSEDRQWAVAEKGQCVEARFFPYAPWELDKAGTFHSARLLKIEACPAPAK